MYDYDAKRTSYDAFKLRFSLDERKFFDDFEKDVISLLRKYIEKETTKIKYRSFEYVEELLTRIQGEITQKLEKIKKKDRLAYNILLKKIKESVKETLDNQEKFEKEFNEAISEDFPKMDQTEIDRMTIFSQIIFHLADSYKHLRDSLTIERFQRSASITDMSKIVNLTTAIFMVQLRVYEFQKLWDDLDDKKRKILQDLILWDLEVLREKTEILPSAKRHRDDISIDNDLLSALLG
ncbi:MAG: hypothetical protein ACTSP4_16075 [Candidatus Hodarchaeales archaeon]